MCSHLLSSSAAIIPSETAVTIEAMEEAKVKDEPNEVAQRWRFLWVSWKARSSDT